MTTPLRCRPWTDSYSTLCNSVNAEALFVAQGRMPPTVPPSLPNYLAEGLPKQDDETLREASEYIDKLLVAREQRHHKSVTEDELPDTAQLLENKSDGAVYLSSTAPVVMRVARV